MPNYEELYEQYATDVLRVCYFYLGDRQKAEDVCQDVFVRLMVNAPQLEEGREKAWLLKVALNRCRDLWRGSWAKRVVLGSPVFELIPAQDDTTAKDEAEAKAKAAEAAEQESAVAFAHRTIIAAAFANHLPQNPDQFTHGREPNHQCNLHRAQRGNPHERQIQCRIRDHIGDFV